MRRPAAKIARGRPLTPRGRPLALGLAGFGLLALSGAVAGPRSAAASCLAAWLVVLALPVGALPITVVAERFGRRVRARGGVEMLGALRRLMGLMPAAAALGLPLAVAAPLLYPHAAPRGAPWAAWSAAPFFALRLALYLAAWAWLCARFSAPFAPSTAPPAATDSPGEGRTVPAVALHAAVGTLFCADVIGALDPRPDAALAGLVVMTAWSGLAFAAAILLAWEEPEPVGRGRTVPGRGRLLPLAVLLGLWAYLHGVQFLAAGSSGLPQEAAWYLARGGAWGRGLALAGGALVGLAGLALLRPGRVITRGLAAAALAVHALEMFWFVTPAVRGRFTLGWSDAACALGLACLAAALRPALARLGPRPAAPRGAA